MAPAELLHRQTVAGHEVCCISELAIAVFVLVGTGLLLKSFWLIRSVDPGFKADNVLTLAFSLDRAK